MSALLIVFYLANILVTAFYKNIFFLAVAIICFTLMLALNAENGISKLRFAVQLVLHSVCFSVVLYYERNYGAYINDYKIILAEIAVLTIFFFANLRFEKAENT